MKVWYPRCVCLLLSLCLLLAGCGSEGTETAAAASDVTAEETPYTVQAFGEDAIWDGVFSYAFLGETLYALERGDSHTLWRMDAFGKNSSAFSVDADGTLSCLTAAQDGLYCLCSQENRVFLEALNPEDGSLLSSTELVGAGGPDYSSLRIDGDGTIYLDDNGSVTMFDANGALITTLDADARRLTVTSSGMICFLDALNILYTIKDTRAEEIGEFEFLESGETAIIVSGVDCDLFIHTASGLYAYNLDGSYEEVLSYAALDEALGSYLLLGAASDGTWLYQVTGQSALGAVVVSDQLAKTEQTQLTVATISENATLKGLISAFNAAHPDYSLTYVCYEELYNISDNSLLATRLKNEFATGNLPDILCFNGNQEQFLEILENAGYLTDLYPLLEDGAFSSDVYFRNIWDAFASGGALYRLCTNFNLSCLVASDELAGAWDGTLSGLMTLQESADTPALLPNVRRDEFLRWNCTKQALSSFIDWDTGVCDFTSSGFAEVLTYAAQLPEELILEDSVTEDLLSGAADLYYVRGLEPVQDTAQWGTIFPAGYAYLAPVTWDSGSVTITAGQSLAITTTCAAPEAALEFIESFLTEDYQDSVSLPVRKSSLQKTLDAMLLSHDDPASAYYGFNSNNSKWNGVSILEPGVTEADTASLLELIETADTSSEVVWPIYSIIAEEASSYFTDSKPVAAVCSIIQNRVQLYLDEQS